MASILNRNGTFYASFYDADRSPKEKRVSLQTNDKSTARSLLARFERLWLTGEVDPWTDDLHASIRAKGKGERLSLTCALERFIDSRRDMNCTDNTIRTYKEIARGLVRCTTGSLEVRRLKDRHVRSYVLEDGLAVGTRRKRYGQVNAFLRWCVDNDYLIENPLSSVPKPKADKKLPVPVQQADVVAVAEAIKRHYRKYRRTGEMQSGSLLWKINAFWFSFLTGLRRAEVARLRWRDVDLEERTIRLRTQKNRREEKLPISKKAASILRRLKGGEPEHFVFRSPGFTATERNQRSFGNNLSRCWRKFRRKANVSEEKDFHALRKGFCSQLAKSGASAVVIKGAARHADIQTSMRYVALHNDSLRGDSDAAF